MGARVVRGPLRHDRGRGVRDACATGKLSLDEASALRLCRDPNFLLDSIDRGSEAGQHEGRHADPRAYGPWGPLLGVSRRGASIPTVD